MAFASSFDAKERVRQAVDIVELVGSYLPLRREGRGYKAICPWHDDSRPSLQVNPERQSYKCWVCDIGGDVFSFIMKIEGVAFPEALAMLADRAGVRIDEPKRSGPAADEKRTLYQALAWAADRFHQTLLRDPTAAGARQYFAERSFTPESIERFRLGYSPEDWNWISQAAAGTPYTQAVLEKVDLVVRKKNGPGVYDRFRGRVLFPIFDAQDRAVGMGGRVLPGAAAEQGAKYLNSRETVLFQKSQLLYGLNLARQAIRRTGTALVMEGYTDVVIAHQCGFENAVAVLGTALGAQHIRLLKRFADQLRIVLVLDGDEAGRRRANEVLQLFVAENADVRVLTLPEECDPAEFLLERGAEAFQTLVDQSPDALAHAVQERTRGIDLARDTHRASEALEGLLDIVAKAPRLRDDSTTEGRLREEAILGRLARDFGLAEEKLRDRVSALRRQTTSKKISAPDSSGPGAKAANPRQPMQKPAPAEREILELLMACAGGATASAGILEQLTDRVKPNQLVTPIAREIFMKAVEIRAAGQSPDFHRLLLEFDDTEVKNLLVELDEQAHLKPNVGFDTRLQDVLASFERQASAAQVRAGNARLKTEQLPEEEALALLLKIQQQVKTRQGISAPTDG